jgi:hypothetical protein
MIMKLSMLILELQFLKENLEDLVFIISKGLVNTAQAFYNELEVPY